MNGMQSELQLGLPTDAQWEYACRAGTITPFSFGDNITPEQVNYNGYAAYGNGKKGLYRETTVSVKSFPENPWGLYEMHGNVHEWCKDTWRDQFGSQAVIDPCSLEGTNHVWRGGSWFSAGHRCRSGSRYRITPCDGGDLFGFRLSIDI